MVARIDFLPDRIRTHRARRRHFKRQGCLMALCLISMVALGQMRYTRISQARGELALIVDREQQAQDQINQRIELEAQQAELMVKKRVDDSLGTRVNAMDILGELQRATPDRLTLISMTIHATELPMAAAQPEGLRVAGAPGASLDVPVARRLRVVLTGLAPSDIDVANFIGQMAASPLFEDVNMGYAKMIVHGNYEAREFQVSCFVIR
ncbi:MAG: PilN domain-containing protein [Planctomycetota bacterium]|jgi:Tfp pilus assembly protein PilN